jgi:hypothetical protein
LGTAPWLEVLAALDALIWEEASAVEDVVVVEDGAEASSSSELVRENRREKRDGVSWNSQS